MSSVLVHTADESVTLTAQAAKRLLERGDGDAALLYLALLRHHGDTLPRSLAGMTSASAANIAEVPTDVPIVTSVKNTISSIGSIFVGILMGYMIQYLGYEFTIYCLAAGMVASAVCWFFAKRVP